MALPVVHNEFISLGYPPVLLQDSYSMLIVTMLHHASPHTHHILRHPHIHFPLKHTTQCSSSLCLTTRRRTLFWLILSRSPYIPRHHNNCIASLLTYLHVQFQSAFAIVFPRHPVPPDTSPDDFIVFIRIALLPKITRRAALRHSAPGSRIGCMEGCHDLGPHIACRVHCKLF